MNILNNYHVLDLTDEKGWLCSKLLADMGARVFRIEKPGRNIAPVYANTGKLGINLDIDTAAGQELFKRLVLNSDALVESFPPGYLSSLGLGYAEISRINPRLIMASITGFGQTGPYRDFKSSDLVASALGGQACVCGDPDRPPLKPFGPQAYSIASLFAANGILLAAWQRHSSNRGQYIDISIHECVAATLDHIMVRYFYERVTAARQGSLYWNNAFRIFPCRDGYILLSLFFQWETLLEWMDSEGLAGDLTNEEWRDENRRRQGIGHVIQVVENWSLQHYVNDLLEMGQLMRFPWAGVASIPEVLDNPQLNERGFFPEAVNPLTGQPYKFPGVPCRLSQSPWQVHSDYPRPAGNSLEF